MKIEDSKLHLLKEELNTGNKLSIDDICELLKIKRTRAYNYLDIIINEGIELNKEKKGKIVYYSINKSLDKKYLFKPISRKDILQFNILTALNKGPKIAKDLCPILDEFYNLQISENKSDMATNDSSHFKLDNDDFYCNKKQVHKTSLYYAAIKEMLDAGMLIKSQKLYPSGSNYPLIIDVDIESLAEVSKCQNQSRALRSIIEKANVLSGNNKTLDDSCFWQYGRGHSYDETITQSFKVLMENHFINKVLKFDYNGKQYHFHTGLLVYCQDKDMLYLLGHKEGGHGNTIVKYPNIQNLSFLDKPNLEYGKTIYRECLVNMFSISVESAEEIELCIKKTADNIRRLERLCSLRTNGKYSSDGKYLIYTDKVSGLNDLKNYLRIYADECEIIKPEKLKLDMHRTIQRTIEKYKEN